jgi:lipid-A-disaccharide synthase-like uncharacterized protein
MVESFVGELSKEPIWTMFGLIGQFTFAGRFILQWLVSEFKKKSHVPVSFWYLSIIGSIILLIYSIHRAEPVFILGFSLNSLIYFRNLHLIYKHKKSGKIGPLERDED